MTTEKTQSSHNKAPKRLNGLLVSKPSSSSKRESDLEKVQVDPPGAMSMAEESEPCGWGRIKAFLQWFNDALVRNGDLATGFTCIIFWLGLDVAYIFDLAHDEKPSFTSWANYWTNMNWMLSAFVRTVIVLSVVFKNLGLWSPIPPGRYGCWWALLGPIQFAILMTIFSIAWAEDGVVNHILDEGMDCQKVIVGNHVRHVSPVILHFLISYGFRDWYTRAVVNDSGTGPRMRTLNLIAFFPVITGGFYLAFADPKSVYHYDKDLTTMLAVGVYCTSLFFGSVFYLYAVPDYKHADTIRSNAEVRYDIVAQDENRSASV